MNTIIVKWVKRTQDGYNEMQPDMLTGFHIGLWASAAIIIGWLVLTPNNPWYVSGFTVSDDQKVDYLECGRK